MGKKIKKAFKKVGEIVEKGGLIPAASYKAQDKALQQQIAFEKNQQQQQDQLAASIRQQQMAAQQLAAANAAQDMQTNVLFGGQDTPEDILGRRRRAGTGNTSTQLGIV